MSSVRDDHETWRSDELLAEIVWPALTRVDDIGIGDKDCVVVCAGFEDRAVGTVRRICSKGSGGFVLYMVTYLPEQVQNRVGEMQEIADSSGIETVEISYDRREPLDVTATMKRIAHAHSRVFVDVSGMSRLLIVQCVVALLGAGCRSLSILYGEADQYVPTRLQFERDREQRDTEPRIGYLSSGIFEIAAVPALASVAMLGEPIRLIAFPSLDPTQLSAVVQELQPAYVNFVHGVPPRTENEWRKDAICWLNERTLKQSQGSDEHEASTFDYRETLRMLLEIYRRRCGWDRLIIAPTGSKMQAVGVGLFRAVLPDVQIVYPTPQTFVEPARYTVGLSNVYRFDVPEEAGALATG